MQDAHTFTLLRTEKRAAERNAVILISVLVKYYLSAIWYFPLFHKHYIIIPYTRTKEITKGKVEPQHIRYDPF